MGMSGTVGIVGFGRFGKLAAKYLVADHPLKIHDPRAASQDVAAMGAESVSLEDASRCRIVILAVPISGLRQVLEQVRAHLSPDSLVVDVCSVKEHPVRWMKELLPPGVAILGTHPMFGPDSAAESLQGRKIVLCPVRIGHPHYAAVRSYLITKGLVVIETSPSEHDRQIAVSLALTHFIGRSLAGMGAKPQDIDTEGYKRLLHILDVVENDTWQLFEDMHRYNPYAMEARQAFIEALQTIGRRLGDGGV